MASFPNTTFHSFSAARDRTGPAPLRYALTLSWDHGNERTLYAYPTSFRSAVEASRVGDRLVASRDYDAYALTETDASYTAAVPLTMTTRATERAA